MINENAKIFSSFGFISSVFNLIDSNLSISNLNGFNFGILVLLLLATLIYPTLELSISIVLILVFLVFSNCFISLTISSLFLPSNISVILLMPLIIKIDKI